MVLQLHVWGPAFGLPSIDAECLAAIAYASQTLNRADYQLIQSSPSAVPTQHLPALHNPQTSTWTSGFTAITTHLHHTQQQQPQTPPPQPTPPTNPTLAADATAYTTFLTSHAAPLLALSLYVSSANYAAATRPAYSAILPLPLPWTEPPAVRAAMVRRAAHLGMDSLDADADAGGGQGEQGGGAGAGGKGVGAGGVGGEGEKGGLGEGWISVPRGLVRPKKGVKGALSPEQRARIRLEGLAREVLDVLGEVEWEGQGVEVRCLAFGYLALMLVPDVPRPWLREVMEGRYPGLCAFVRGFRGEVFSEGRALPWVGEGEGASAVGVAGRFARGVLCEVPGVGAQWSRWWTARKKGEVLASSGVKAASSGGLLLLLGAGLGVVAVGAGVFFYRGLPRFGEAVQVWRKPMVTLSAFGAAGAMFSGAMYGLD